MPLRIAIQTWGSNGDVRPMLALAHGLVRRGHGVTLLVSSLDNRNYAEEAARLGVAYRQVPEHFNLDLEDFARRSFAMHGLQWLKALLNEAFFPYEALIYQAACELAASHDLLIGHHFLYPLKLAARQQGKPHISVTLCPVAIASPEQAPMHCPDMGPWVNRWLWRLANQLFNWYLKPLTRLWRESGQPPVKQVFDDLLTSDRLDLVAVDPVFCPHLERQPLHQLCGFFNLEADSQSWLFPESLQTFLDEGEQPIYCTFGSLQQAVPEWSMALFIDAVAQAGCRAIIQTSSAKFPAGSRQGNCYFIGRHPHQPVFERCRLVVHHGGAGTSHAATRAGCASVVAPFMDEQLYWALQLQRLGLAPAPLPAKRADASQLAKRIRQILNDPDLPERAARYRQLMTARDGVSVAVDRIEALISASGL